MYLRDPAESMLSEEVKYLLVIDGEDDKSVNVFIAKDGTLDWQNVENFFGSDIVQHDQPLPYEYCKSITNKFHTLLASSSKVTYSKQLLQWTNRFELIQSLTGADSTIGNLGTALILTSIVEYSLGNVYQTETGTVPPHLLRDLLRTDALVRVLGEIPVYLLRLLLGTPNGINLRNLVWHGFPSEEEVSGLYNHFLLLLLTAVGDILETRSYRVEFRTCSQEIAKLVREMNLEYFETERLTRYLTRSSDMISNAQRIKWQRTLGLYENGYFYHCVSMALPQLEMYLRRLYGRLYQIDPKARIDEYYIIMDTIFAETDSSGVRNKIHGHFSPALLELMYDILSALAGPRIRDKLSHGELPMTCIDDTVANRVLLVCYLFMGDNGSDFVYSSIFHPNAILRKSLVECELAMERCEVILLPSELASSNEVDDESALLFIPRAGINGKVPIFYRHPKEDEIVGLLQRISTVLKLASESLYESLSSRLKALEGRELRSRGRNTLVNMLRMFPTIRRGLQFSLLLVKWIFHCLMECNGELQNVKRIIRLECPNRTNG
ncbi:endoplasmic reticulum membrane-associated RNA degradation protein-like isoform X2 [Toxorhynchites rutilus septentrionalis]|uniref:endoplasmic reticulum membrane-associated RNA degradation protein-like isoform X2 n=1 Tax=Toxorhynchites rutilus septentrionalis TaxID=329112 RepID=UPI002479EE29|nr:endoplasmic reticulum membrane-associated RNA degradation protein-like isoform X2 [Toxorhynchites rutilus septentrionalis]